MTVGDKVTERPYFSCAYGLMDNLSGLRSGVVVYIHPQGRFYTVEFTSDRGNSWRESFYPMHLRGNPHAPRTIDGFKHVPDYKIRKTQNKAGLYG